MLEKSNLPVWGFAIKVMKYRFYDPCKIILPLSWFHMALKTSLSIKIEHISCSKLWLFAIFTLLWCEIILKGQILNHYALITVSMTSLLPHTVAQSTKWRFLLKNLSQLVIFVIELAFTWSWVNKNHQNLIFKVNLLCQKSVL